MRQSASHILNQIQHSACFIGNQGILYLVTTKYVPNTNHGTLEIIPDVGLTVPHQTSLIDHDECKVQDIWMMMEDEHLSAQLLISRPLMSHRTDK